MRLTFSSSTPSPVVVSPIDGCVRTFRSVATSLPPRALPHRFKGSAPGELPPGHHLSRPSRQPPWCLHVCPRMLSRDRDARPRQRPHEVLELRGSPALEGGAV